MEEILLVDIDDTEIGYMPKADVHKYGKLHRAFSVFIVHDGKMLIQKRNKDKYHSGGLWTNACCSHQRRGETLEDAVERCMLDELGTTCRVEEQYQFVYRTTFAKDLFEFEIDHVFLGDSDDFDGELCIDPDEAEAIEWVEFGALKRRLADDPECFTSWFIIAAPQVMKILER